MNRDASGDRLDAAIHAITTAPTSLAVAEELARQAMSTTTARAAWVIDGGEKPPRIITHCAAPDVDPPTAELTGHMVASVAQESQGPVEIDVATEQSPIVAYVVTGCDVRMILALAGVRAPDSHDTIALLAEIAAAALERIAAHGALRQHAAHVRGLGERLVALGNSLDDAATPGTTTDALPDTAQLTVREREILEFVASGESNGEIAEHLTLSVETVKTHVKRILRKLNAANRSELIAMFARGGID